MPQPPDGAKADRTSSVTTLRSEASQIIDARRRSALYCLIIAILPNAGRRARRPNWRTSGLAAVLATWCEVHETVQASVVSEHLWCEWDFIIRTTAACSTARQIAIAIRAISLGAFLSIGTG